MNLSDKDNCIVLQSPIEFLIAGAAGQHDRILVRSLNCQLDLIGFVQEGAKEYRRPVIGSKILGFPSRDRSSMRTVESFPLKRGARSGDSRESSYRFCWVGYATRSEEDRIRDLFQRQTVDLEDGIERQDLAQVEWSIAPVVFQCSLADMRRRNSRQSSLILVALYFLIALVAVAISASWTLQRLAHP
jgi:hypothetical protein